MEQFTSTNHYKHGNLQPEERRKCEQKRREEQGKGKSNGGHKRGALAEGVEGESSHDVPRKPCNNAAGVQSSVRTGATDNSSRTKSELDKKKHTLTEDSSLQV